MVLPWIISKISADLRRAVHRLISPSIAMLMRISKQDYMYGPVLLCKDCVLFWRELIAPMYPVVC